MLINRMFNNFEYDRVCVCKFLQKFKHSLFNFHIHFNSTILNLLILTDLYSAT